MTNEQDKAIERCNNLIRKEHSSWIGISNQKAIEKLLNMLKEKDEEIEFQKDINKQEKDRHKQAEKSLKGQIKKLKTDFKIVDQECSRLERKEAKQDKMIDLIINTVYKRFKAELLLEYGFENEKQFKQYFERKVEDGN